MGDTSADPEMEEFSDDDLDALVMMLDEDLVEEPECKESTSPVPSTAQELGLVLSDEEDEAADSQPPESNSSFSSFSEAFANSKFSNKQMEKENNGGEDIDPLEAELQEMEKRAKALREALAKKKRLDAKASTKFTKLTTTSGKEKKASSRTLSAKEESELREKLKKGSELHSGDTDSEDEEDKRNPMEQRYNTHGQDIKRRIAHQSQSQRNERVEKVVSNKGSATEKPGWKNKEGALVSLASSGTTASQDTDKNVTLDMYSGIRIV